MSTLEASDEKPSVRASCDKDLLAPPSVYATMWNNYAHEFLMNPLHDAQLFMTHCWPTTTTFTTSKWKGCQQSTSYMLQIALSVTSAQSLRDWTDELSLKQLPCVPANVRLLYD